MLFPPSWNQVWNNKCGKSRQKSTRKWPFGVIPVPERLQFLSNLFGIVLNMIFPIKSISVPIGTPHPLYDNFSQASFNFATYITNSAVCIAYFFLHFYQTVCSVFLNIAESIYYINTIIIKVRKCIIWQSLNAPPQSGSRLLNAGAVTRVPSVALLYWLVDKNKLTL